MIQISLAQLKSNVIADLLKNQTQLKKLLLSASCIKHQITGVIQGYLFVTTPFSFFLINSEIYSTTSFLISRSGSL